MVFSMSDKNIKLMAVLFTAWVQGLCITLIPGSSFIYKSIDRHAITDQQYGILFLPLIVGSIVINLLFRKIVLRFQPRYVFRVSIIFHLVFVVLWGGLSLTVDHNALSFFLLCASNLCLGIGFGLLITFLNLMAVQLYPEKRDAVLAALHGVIGIGAAISPQILQALFAKGNWLWSGWLIVILFGIVFVINLILKLDREDVEKIKQHMLGTIAKSGTSLPRGPKIFLIAVFFYGIIEAMVSNWCGVFLIEEKSFSYASATGALSSFWLFITVGRIFATAYSIKFDSRKIFVLSPIVMIAGLFGMIIYQQEKWTFMIFALIGLGCSYFFPLAVSLATTYFDLWREKIAGFSVVSLMAGVGVGSSLTGLLRNIKWFDLKECFLGASFIAGIMFAVVYYLFFLSKMSCSFEKRKLS
jgi:fucose permease